MENLCVSMQHKTTKSSALLRVGVEDDIENASNDSVVWMLQQIYCNM